MRKKIILDMDPGIDDAIAILLACRSPELEILGITTVGGNVPLELTTKNALRMLEFVGAENIPVYAGMRGPIFGELRTAEFVHGQDGIGDVNLPEPSKKPAKGHAVDFIRKEVMEKNPGEISIVATGPLSNVAMALLLEPEIARRLSSIVIMGGAYATTPWGYGNESPRAEFNIATDPLAAKIVFNSGAKIYAFGLDVTMRPDAGISKNHYEQIGRAGTKTGDLIHKMLRRFVHLIEPVPMHDPMALAYTIKPEIFKFRRLHVDVEVCGTLTRGETLADLREWLPESFKKPANANICVDLDGKAFIDLLISRVVYGR